MNGPTCDIGLYVRRLAPAMSVDIAPGISEWPAVVFSVQKKLSAFGFESTVQEMWAVSFSDTP